MARLRKFVQQARYDVQASIGEMKSVEDPTDGISRKHFVSSFKIWLARYDINSIEQMLNTGPNQQDNQIFATKELGKIKRNMLVRLPDEEDDGEEYIVTNVSSAVERWDPRAYDLITLTRGNGVESSYRSVGS